MLPTHSGNLSVIEVSITNQIEYLYQNNKKNPPEYSVESLMWCPCPLLA